MNIQTIGKRISARGQWLAETPLQDKVTWAIYGAIVVALVMYVIGFGSPAVFGQSNQLNIDAETITAGLFSGANIIIGALGAVVFLLIGFTFGAKILSAIGAFVQRISF